MCVGVDVLISPSRVRGFDVVASYDTVVLQVIIGSFLTEGWKESRSWMQPKPLSSSMPKFIPEASAVGSPPSLGNLSESSWTWKPSKPQHRRRLQ